MANLTNINGKFVVDTSGLGIFGDVGSSFSTPGGFGQLGVFKTSAAAMFTLQSSGGNGRQYTLLSQSNGAFVIYDGPSCDHRMEISSGGEVTFSGNVKVTGAFKDSSGDAGTSGQILSSTATGTNWIDNDTGDVSGSGTTNAVAKFTGAKVIGDGPITFATNDSTFAGTGEFAGAIRITETSTAQNILIGNQDSGGTNKPSMIQSSNANLSIGYGDSWTGEGGTMTQIMTVNSSQNVGIGITSPDGKLQTFSTTKNTDGGYGANNFGIIVSQDNADNAGDEGNGICFTQQYAADGVDSAQVRTGAIIGHKVSATGSFGGGLKFKVQPAGANPLATALTLSNNSSATFAGNVGVGISPTAKLHIQGTNSANGGIKIQNNGGNPYAIYSDNNDLLFTNGNGSTTALTIAYSGNSTFAGNVLIGATSAAAGVLVVDGNSANNIWVVGRDSDGTGSLSFRNAADNAYNARLEAVSGALKFETNGTLALTIDSSQNVGIGTDSPSAKLEIRNDVAASTDLDPTAIKLYNNSDGGSAIEFSNGVSGNSKLSFGVESTGAGTDDTFLGFSTSANTTMSERMRITSAGNVGIGTTSPTYKLQVNGTSYINETLYVNGNTTIDANLDLTSGGRVKVSGGNTDQYYFEGSRNGVGVTYRLYDNANNIYHDSYTSQVFRLNQIGGSGGNLIIHGGNVGIGTTSPTFKLQTNATIAGSWLGYLNGTSATFGTNNFSAVHSSTAIGTGTESGINLANNASDNGAPSPIISFSAKSASASYQHAYAAIYGIKTASGADANWNTGDLVFATGQSTGPIERMRIDSSGRVLINQSSNLTGQVLQVNGFIDILNVSASALRWYDGTTFISGLGLDSWATGGSASNMTMFCEGEFGIVTGGGNTKKLVMNTSGSVTVSGDLVAYGSPSDKRLKENIKPIKSALDKVSKLQGVTFNWKESGSILDIKEDVGFIAQDVQKVIPELVRENKDGMLSMRHQGIAPILLEAIKELKAEIEKLKSNKCNCNK